MKPPRRRLGLVTLEDRSLLTTFGIPWADPSHLTISFAPDGTATPYGASALTQVLGQSVPTATWQREVLRAFQTWADYANINVGLVADGGQPLGSVGAVQGDTRFGDARIAAASLASTLLANTAPFSWSGTTLSGDVVFNSAYPFGVGSSPTANDIFSVALHEAGHVFGLDHSSAADSPMNETYAYHAGLTSDDIANLQAMYGTRAPDATGNNSLSTAAWLPQDGLLSNRYITTADLSTLADVDYYKFNVPLLGGILGVSVRLQCSGFSLLTPKVTVYNSAGQAVTSALSTNPMNNDLSLQFAPSLLGGTYFVKVEHATQDVFGIGSYRLAVDYLSLGSILTPLEPLLAPILDNHTNDTLGLAQLLSPLSKPAPDSRFDYTYRGVIEDNSDADNYKIHATNTPTSGSLNLDVVVWALQTNGLDPRISIYNAATGAPVAFQVLANDAGVMDVQIPNVSATTNYILQVKARTPGSAHGTGSYFLGADFNQFALTTFDGVSSNTLAPSATDSAQLTINAAAVYEFALSAAMLNLGSGQAGGVVMTVTDANGQTVLALSVDAGLPAVTTARYLALGTYTVTYTYRPISGATAGPLQYDMFLLEVTDGVGPYAPGGGTSGGTTSSGGYTYSGSSTTKPNGNYYYF